MYKIGLAQEIIPPPVGVGLAGYMNKRPNIGMYDDLYVKTVIIDNGKVRCGIVVFDLVAVHAELLEVLRQRITEKFGKALHDNLIICANHTHTGPEIRFSHLPGSQECAEQIAEAVSYTKDTFLQIDGIINWIKLFFAIIIPILSGFAIASIILQFIVKPALVTVLITPNLPRARFHISCSILLF